MDEKTNEFRQMRENLCGEKEGKLKGKWKSS